MPDIKQSPDENANLTKAQKKALGALGHTDAITCVRHGGKALSIKNHNFYQSKKGSIYEGLGYIPVCKKCMQEMFLKYYYDNGSDAVKAIYYMCRKLDVKFEVSRVDGALKKAKGKVDSVWGWYVAQVNSLTTGDDSSENLSGFDGSEILGDNQGGLEARVSRIQENYKLNRTEKQHAKDIETKLGYNPFDGSGHNDYQLAQLYTELVAYLEDDDLATDSYKLNVVLQMINNNQQIRQLDLYISLMNGGMVSLQDNINTLNTLYEQKKKLNDMNVKLYKENKWLEADTSGRSKLSGLLKKYKNYMFDEIEVDYFDILTSKSVKTVMDLSHKSIADTLSWSNDDEKEVILLQRELISEKDSEIAKLEEEKRKLAIEFRDYKMKNEG